MSWRTLPKEIRQHIISFILHDVATSFIYESDEKDIYTNNVFVAIYNQACLDPTFLREDVEHPTRMLLKDYYARESELAATITNIRNDMSMQFPGRRIRLWTDDEHRVRGIPWRKLAACRKEQGRIAECMRVFEMMLKFAVATPVAG